MITSYGYGLLGEKKTDKASSVPAEKKKRQTKKKTPKK